MSDESSLVPALVEESRALSVKTALDYHKGVHLIRELHAMRDRVKATFQAPKSLANQAHQAIIAAERPFLEALDEAEECLRRGLVRFANAKEDVARRQTEDSRRVLLEEARREAISTAAMLIADGEREAAENLLAQPVRLVKDPVWPAAIPHSPGVSHRHSWKAKVTDPDALLRWAVENNRGDLFAPVERALDQLARKFRGEGAPPGVRFIPSNSVAIGKPKR